jgi:hypothetical protein
LNELAQIAGVGFVFFVLFGFDLSPAFLLDGVAKGHDHFHVHVGFNEGPRDVSEETIELFFRDMTGGCV